MLNISLLPISSINLKLNSIEGWVMFETETLLLELGWEFSQLLSDKIGVLRVVKSMPKLFYSDAMFFLHATSVMNNNEVNFENIPSVNSLEVAFAIVDMSRVLDVHLDNSPMFTSDVRTVVKHILIDDGYSEVPSPFNVVGITGLSIGQLSEDILNKAKAIVSYVTSMYKGNK